MTIMECAKEQLVLLRQVKLSETANSPMRLSAAQLDEFEKVIKDAEQKELRQGGK